MMLFHGSFNSFFLSRQYKIISESEDGSVSSPLTAVSEFDPSSPTELILG